MFKSAFYLFLIIFVVGNVEMELHLFIRSVRRLEYLFAARSALLGKEVGICSTQIKKLLHW
jgi:hypothetical protein